MGFCIDIRIDSYGDAGFQAKRTGDSVDGIKFFFALYIKCGYTGMKRVIDLLVRFTRTVKCDLFFSEPTRKRNRKLTAADNACAGTLGNENAEYARIGICLYRIGDIMIVS